MPGDKSENIYQELKPFFDACNDFIDGKFILVDIKISNILRNISKNSTLYDLIAECMINYDFDSIYSEAKISDTNKKFILPDKDYKIIPFVFCLLVEIDSKRIVFEDFLKEQFPDVQTKNDEYDAFGKNVIIPFKNSIAKIFDIDLSVYDTNGQEPSNVKEDIVVGEENNSLVNGILDKQLDSDVESTQVQTKQEGEVEDDLTLLLNRVSRIARVLDDKLILVKNPLKKSNIKLLTDALIESCQNRLVKTIVAIVMSLNHFAGGERSMRGEIQELNTICYDFYE